MISIQLTAEEWKHIQERRWEREQFQKKKQKQDICKHLNKIHEGRFGHNGDDWYRCPDCKKEWSE